MSQEVIEIVRLERLESVEELKDAFELREDRPALWLQRICLYVLRKLGCFACTKTFSVERHHVGKNGKRFMDALWDQRRNVYDYLDREPSRLLIGSQDFDELMQSRELSQEYFGFHAQYNVGNDARRSPTIMGLEVEVVPWMRGILVMPDRPTRH